MYGSLVYGAFLFIVLFTGFTIVIAIITDSYEQAREEVTQDALIKRGLAYVAESLPAAEDLEDSDEEDGKTKEEKEEKKGGEDEEEPDMRAVMVMMTQMAGQITQMAGQMEQLTGRMERMEQKLDNESPVLLSAADHDRQSPRRRGGSTQAMITPGFL